MGDVPRRSPDQLGVFQGGPSRTCGKISGLIAVEPVRQPPMRVNIREAGQISSLKGDQISAQGFSPGLGNSRRCALKGHPIPTRHIGSKSLTCVSSFWRHFQGAFLRGGYPGLKPWAELFCPFGAQTLYPSPMLTRMGSRRMEKQPTGRGPVL
jgi:hypothetical protein